MPLLLRQRLHLRKPVAKPMEERVGIPLLRELLQERVVEIEGEMGMSEEEITNPILVGIIACSGIDSPLDGISRPPLFDLIKNL